MKEERLTISQLRQQLAKAKGITEAEAASFIDAMFNQIIVGLREDGQVRISGLGTLRVQWNEPRKSIDVNTGNEITINGYNKVSFLPESAVKERVNEPYAHLESKIIDDDGNQIVNEGQIDPIQKLGEEAENIMGIIADINNIRPQEKQDNQDNQDNQETSVTPEISEEQENSENSIVPDNTEKTETHENPIISVTPEVNTPQQPVEPIQSQSTIPHEFVPPIIDSPQTEQHKSNTTAIVIGIILSVILLLLIVAYFVFQPQVDKWVGDTIHNLRSEKTEQVVEPNQNTTEQTTETVEIQPTEPIVTEEQTLNPMQIVVDDTDATLSESKPQIQDNKIAEEAAEEPSIFQRAVNWVKALFNKDNNSDKNKIEEQMEEQAKEQTEEQTKEQENSEADNVQETSMVQTPVQESKPIEIEENHGEPARYEVIKQGVTLAALARKYYHGQTDFWVYIFEANRDQLDKPNSARLGMKLRIPYIDDGNPDIIIEAKRKVEEYKKMK